MDDRRFDALALLLGQRIDVRGLDNLASTPPLVLAVAPEGRAVVFRYGVIVLFGVDDAARARLLDEIAPRVQRPYDATETEEIEILVDPAAAEGTRGESVVVREASVERLQLVAEVLARAVTLAHHEIESATVFDRIEPLAAAMQEQGRPGRRARALIRHIGGALLVQHRMIGRAQVSERPDILWDFPDLERLFIRLAEYYELRDRHMALERKLQLVADTAQTLHDLLQSQRSLRVEWYIVVLILFEVAMSVYDRFLGV